MSMTSFFCVFVMLILICVSDIRYRRISNNLLLLLGGVVIAHCFHVNNLSQLVYSLAGFVVGFTLWYLGVFGAGDAKLLAIVMPLVNSELYFPFALIVLMAGGAQACIMMLVAKINGTKCRRDLAFGVPISIGASVGLLLSLAGV
jgi:prepilin peptidase CpaA